MLDARAIESLRLAVQGSPDNVPLSQHLAEMFVASGRLEEAQTEYQAAAQAEPDNEATLLGWGRVLHQLGHPEAAAARFARILRRDITVAEAHKEMARVLMTMRQLEKAQRHYREAMKLDP